MTKRVFSRPARNTLVAGSITIAAVLSWLAGAYLQEYDFDASRLIFNALGEKQNLDQSINPFLKFFVDLAVSAISIFAGYKLISIARCIAFIQLLALSVLLQVVLFYLQIPPLNPVSLSIAVVVGILFGATLKMLSEAEKRISEKNQEILLRNQELIESRLKIVKQDEIERRILAGDLHDQVLNDLKTVRQKVQSYRKTSEELERAELTVELDNLLAQSMDGIREVMDNLSPAVLEHLGFVEAVEDLIRKGSCRAGYKVRFKSDLDASDFKHLGVTELTLIYRIVQESVNNICKHSQAQKVRCLLSKKAGRIHLTIADDGVGVNAGSNANNSGTKKDSAGPSGKGIEYMQQRASILNAVVTVRTAEKGTGTVVDISL